MKERVINNSTVTLATTSSTISPAIYGSKRLVLALTNTSTAGEIISIAIGAEAKAGQGIVLNQGDKTVLSADSGYLPPSDIINARASAATATLAIYEEIELG